MTEIQQHEPRKKRGVGRSKKLSTKVDLTPMVDLGFLLITFFVFTTTTATPTAMNLILPHADNKDSMITSESKTINLILADNDKIFYYNGDSIINIRSTNYSPTGLRNVLLNKKAVVENMFGDAKETVVLIKPTKDANYKNIVDVIDEMLIDQISRYVLMEADKNEIASLTSKR